MFDLRWYASRLAEWCDGDYDLRFPAQLPAQPSGVYFHRDQAYKRREALPIIPAMAFAIQLRWDDTRIQKELDREHPLFVTPDVLDPERAFTLPVVTFWYDIGLIAHTQIVPTSPSHRCWMQGFQLHPLTTTGTGPLCHASKDRCHELCRPVPWFKSVADTKPMHA